MIDTLPASVIDAILDQPGEAACPGVEIELHRSLGSPLPLSSQVSPELTAHIYRPTLLPSEPTPALLSFHGGGFQFGSPESCGPLAKALALTLGMTTIAPTYRLATQENPTFPGVLDDALHAWRWALSHSDELHLDTSRIAVAGESAGNLLAMHLAVSSPFIDYTSGEARPSAFICQWGPLDFVARWFDLNENAGPESVLLGADYLTDPGLYHQASPLSHAHGDLPPSLFFFGRQDNLVSPRQGRLALAAWQAANKHAELYVIANIGHCTHGDNRSERRRILNTTISFLSHRMAGLPNMRSPTK